MGETTPWWSPPKARCAIYTRKSSEEGLEQAFNSLDTQREACAACRKSTKVGRLFRRSTTTVGFPTARWSDPPRGG